MNVQKEKEKEKLFITSINTIMKIYNKEENIFFIDDLTELLILSYLDLIKVYYTYTINIIYNTFYVILRQIIII